MTVLSDRPRQMALCAIAATIVSLSAAARTRDALPASLTDAEFWALSSRLSEPNGFFQSNSGSTDNLLSNENTISVVAAQLASRAAPDGVYLGVGPEQNFTYIAAMRPRMAFITDIRRGNLDLHLVYKAAFDLSANRADFLARLFTRRRPPGLTPQSSAADLMRAYLAAPPGDAAAFAANLTAIDDHLRTTRHLPLDADDLAGIEYVLRAFHRFGPAITYTSTIGMARLGSYAQILTATDGTGTERTFLANEDLFNVVKTLESRNLIVPIVGDFAGPKALRAIGAYLKAQGGTVSAFYVSNVEQYLERNGVWAAFCANVATLPLDRSSIFIRPGGRGAVFSPMAAETAACRGR